MNSNPYAYETDLSRSQGEFSSMMDNMQGRLDALQKPALLEKAKALKKRGQDLQKKAQDVQSSIELGLGAPLGPVVSKQIIQPASKYAKKFLGDRIAKAGEKAKSIVGNLKSKSDGILNRGSTPTRSGPIKGEETEEGTGLEDMKGGEFGGSAPRTMPAVAERAELKPFEFGQSNRTAFGSKFRKASTETDLFPSEQKEADDGESKSDPFETKSGEGGEGAPEAQTYIRDRAPVKFNQETGKLNVPSTGNEAEELSDLAPKPSAVIEGVGGDVSKATNIAKTLLSGGEDAAKVAKTALVGGAEGAEDTLAGVAAANAFDPIGWVIGAGLAIGGLVEGVSAMADSAQANAQEKVADAIPLPKSPPINFAGKIVVPVNSAVGQE